MNDRGLDADGAITREGALDRVPAAFTPVVEAVRTRISRTFGSRLHSAYLYGSIPRGTARVGRSDLDLVLALNHEPAERDRAEAKAVEAALDDSFPQVNGVGILLFSVRTLLSDLERYDLGFFVACLCTPLLGPDLPRWRARLAEARTDAERQALSRVVARRLVRTGFTLVMPRWDGWTSDLSQGADLFASYYPERAGQMLAAATAGRVPSSDPAVLRMLIDDLGPWLASEYTAVHGEKAPRPELPA